MRSLWRRGQRRIVRRQAGWCSIRLAHRRRRGHPRLNRERWRRSLLRGPLAGGRLRDTGPAANGRRLRYLRSRWRLPPRIHGRLLGRHRPSALLRHALWRHPLLRRRHTRLTRPRAESLLRLARWRVLLPPRVYRRLRRLGLAGPGAGRLLRHNRLLRLRSGLRIGLHRARLRPAGLLRHHWLLRHDRLLRRGTLARPASLLRRRESDYAEQADRLPPALRTTEGLRGPLNLKAAVRTAKGVHGLGATSQPRWPSCRLCRCRGARSIPIPG